MTAEPTEAATEAMTPTPVPTTFNVALSGAVNATLTEADGKFTFGKNLSTDQYGLAFSGAGAAQVVSIRFSGTPAVGDYVFAGMVTPEASSMATAEATADMAAMTPEATMEATLTIVSVEVRTSDAVYSTPVSGTLSITSVGDDGSISGSFNFVVSGGSAMQAATPEATADMAMAEATADATTVTVTGTFANVPPQ
jgi:hypothetical protein